MLSQVAIEDPKAFDQLVELAKSGLEQRVAA
jgi:ribosomal protein L20